MSDIDEATGIAVNMAGLREFSRIYAVPSGLRDHLRVILATVPYQVVLAAAAVWAGVRQIMGARNWAKTPHFGNHRLIVPSTPMVQATGSSLALAAGPWTKPGQVTRTDFRALDVGGRRDERAGSGRRTFAELLIDCEKIGRPGRCWSGCCGKLTTETWKARSGGSSHYGALDPPPILER